MIATASQVNECLEALKQSSIKAHGHTMQSEGSEGAAYIDAMRSVYAFVNGNPDSGNVLKEWIAHTVELLERAARFCERNDGSEYRSGYIAGMRQAQGILNRYL